MRPEHVVRPRPRPTPDSARPRPRPRPKSCYETETKNYETETSMINSIARESKTNWHVLLANIYYMNYLK